MIPVVRHGRWQGVQFLCSFFLFVPVKNARIVQCCVSPVFVETQKKTAWKCSIRKYGKKHGKKPSGKKLEVFLLMIFLWGSKILRKQGDFLKFPFEALRPS